MNFKQFFGKYILALVILVGSSSIWAAELQSAKSSGLIGEQSNGYLGLVVANAPTDVKTLVKEVNNKRKALYQQVAKKQNVSLAKIEKIAGKKAFEKTSPGNYVKVNGKWIKR